MGLGELLEGSGSLGTSTQHVQLLRDFSGCILANQRWDRKCDLVLVVLWQNQAEQSQPKPQHVLGSAAILHSFYETRENKS